MMELVSAPCDLEARDSRRRSALFYAVESDDFPVVLSEILLQHGARVNVRDEEKRTPLLRALEKLNSELITRLSELDEITMIDLVRQCSRDDDDQQVTVQLVSILVRRGSNIRIRATDGKGRTALHTAASMGCMAIVSLLRGFEDLVDMRDNQDETALSLAARSGWHDVVECLCTEFQATLDTEGASDWTPLHWAAREGHRHVVSALLAKGANFRAITISGDTTIHRMYQST